MHSPITFGVLARNYALVAGERRIGTTPAKREARLVSRPSGRTPDVGEEPRPGGSIGFWEAVGTGSTASLVWALAAAIFVAAISGIVIIERSPTYQSQAVLLIDQPTALAAEGEGEAILKLSRLRAKYQGLVQTRTLLEPTAERAQLPLTVVAESVVEPTVPAPTLTFVVAARGGDRERVHQITEALAATLVAYVNDELEEAGVPPAERYRFEVVNPATPGSKFDDDTAASLTVAAASGLVTLAVVYVGVQLLASRRRLR